MISAWHLAWIIPAAVGLGILLVSVAHAASKNSRREERWHDA